MSSSVPFQNHSSAPSEPIAGSFPQGLEIRVFITSLMSVVPSETIAAMRHVDLPPGRPSLSDESRRVHDLVSRTYRDRNAFPNLERELTDFHLYRDWDRSLALTVCFILACQGRDALEGMQADYSPDGIYYDLAPKDYMPDGRPGFWDRLSPHFKEGDRILHHWSPGYRLLCIFRGDRIVHEFLHQHQSYAPGYKDVHYFRCVERYRERGGVRAYLRGEFTWSQELMESLRLPTDWAESMSYIKPELVVVDTE